MALTKIKVNEIDEKSAPVAGDYALVSDSENDGKLALIPFSEITGALAPLDSPALTGTPTAPTAADGTNTTQLATTAFVQTTADTLQSRWAYQGESGGVITGEPWKIHGFGFSATLNLPLASTVPDGTQIAAMVIYGAAAVTITRQAGDNFLSPTGPAESYTLQGAGSSLVLVKVTSDTWAALGSQEALINAAIAPLAPLASPALTGTPTAPTAAAGTNTTQIATTAFVQAAINSFTNVSAYGAVGDGVTDDSAALIAAFQAGVPISLGSGKTYRIASPLVATCPSLDVIGDNCKIVYDGTEHVIRAVSLTLANGKNHRIKGLHVDANEKANCAIYITCVGGTLADDERPNLYASEIIAENAYRATTEFLQGAEGIMISGVFLHVVTEKLIVREIHTASAAMVSGYYGASGIRYHGGIKNISANDISVENVWTDDPTNYDDQDGISVFQKIVYRTETCFLRNIVVKNTGGRAIKLHSAVNAVIDGVYIEKNSNVIPQTVPCTQAAIDLQQCPATVKNVRVHYDGAWNEEIVGGTIDDPVNDYGAYIISGITARIRNASGNIIVPVQLAAANYTNAQNIDLSVSDISIDGETALLINARLSDNTADKSRVTISNVSGSPTIHGIGFRGTASTSLSAANIINTGAIIPLFSIYNSSHKNAITTSGIVGFSVDEVVSISNDKTVFAYPSAYQTKSYISSLITAVDDMTSVKDAIILLAPTAQQTINTKGTIYVERNATTAYSEIGIEFSVYRLSSNPGITSYLMTNGHNHRTAKLVTCTYGGTEYIAIRVTSAIDRAVKAVFTGSHFGSFSNLKMLNVTSVTGITDVVNTTAVTRYYQPIQLSSYSSTALPPAADFTGCQIWVTNLGLPAYSDGTNWRKYSDGSTI